MARARDLMVEAGMPADSIRFIQEAAGNPAKKAQMMEDARRAREVRHAQHGD